ncbi:MAG TPA: tRNA lysidine(34) synthetase TilS [Methylomirabilota bacterium]|nr:tRNA lysidine(34) synthetase TilS [Methylomirabilota bacterium]
MDLVHDVRSTIRRHAMLAGGETVLVSVSGGADSVALLHVLKTLAPPLALTLHVLHVDHGLRPDSARDGEFVRALGARLGVPVEVVRVQVGTGSVEAAARAARHAALEAAADRAGATRIALGHTADDQAETLLMRLLEGTGVRGLAGIPAVRGRLIRPLLESRHRATVAMLAAAGLEWLEDPSNRDPRFFRNRVRHTLLPRLAEDTGGDLVARLGRLARGARETIDAIDRVAALERERLARPEDGALVLSRAALAALPRPVAAEVLRGAAALLGSRAPLRAWGHRGLRRVLAEPPPRRPFRLGGVLVEVSGDRVRVGGALPATLPQRELAVPGRVELPEIGRALEAVVLPAAGYATPRARDRVAFDAADLPERLVVRARRRGDRFRPFGGGDRRLKAFLIDAKVPRWDRDRLPLVDAGRDILWVAGVRRGAAAPVTARTGTVVELRLVPLA